MAESLAAFVQQAVVVGTAAHDVEREVWKRVLAMGRQATGYIFQMQGDGDVGETIEMPESEYPYVLQDWAGALCVEHAFGRTAETLDTILGLSLPVDSGDGGVHLDGAPGRPASPRSGTPVSPNSKDTPLLRFVTALHVWHSGASPWPISK